MQAQKGSKGHRAQSTLPTSSEGDISFMGRRGGSMFYPSGSSQPARSQPALPWGCCCGLHMGLIVRHWQPLRDSGFGSVFTRSFPQCCCLCNQYAHFVKSWPLGKPDLTVSAPPKHNLTPPLFLRIKIYT